jgi:hypothetical protein
MVSFNGMGGFYIFFKDIETGDCIDSYEYG